MWIVSFYRLYTEFISSCVLFRWPTVSVVHVAKPPHREQMLSDDGFEDNLTTSETDSPSPKSMPAAVRISVCVSSFVCMCISVK